MRVVRHSAGGQRLEFVFACDAGHVWPQSVNQIRRDNRTTVFGRKDAMVEAAAICVRHRARILFEKEVDEIKRRAYFIRFSAVPLKGDSVVPPLFSRR